MNDLEHIAIERLKAASEMSLLHYGQPLIITDSGGKDSSVVKELALRSGIPFEIMHNHTTADAPETVRFVRQEAKRFEELGIKYTINMPMYKGKRTSMWSLIPQKLMPPTRLVRYCCAVLKETGGAGRFIATGVRWAESASRKNSIELLTGAGNAVVDKAIEDHSTFGMSYAEQKQIEADYLIANGVTITPAVPGPSEADPNVMEACFHNGERHMKEQIGKELTRIAEHMPCITLVQAMAMLEGL